MRSTPEVGMPVVLKMDENSEKMPRRMVITNVLDKDMQNIVLIGMPGSGKTSIGKLLAKSFSRKFYDSDSEFLEKYKITPADFISKYGENEFRDKESLVLNDLCKLSNSVISTGGGAVVRESNYQILHQNSIIIYVSRPLDALDTKNRPLSKDLFKLFELRSPLYEKFADKKIENNSKLLDAVQKIGKILDI